MSNSMPVDAPERVMRSPIRAGDDLRGIAQLLVRGVIAATDLTETVHANILGLPDALLGHRQRSTTRGIPRIAYQGVRKVAGLVGSATDDLLVHLAPRFGHTVDSEQRAALIAALNGVLGDHLLASGNPLALQSQLLLQGQPLPREGQA